MSEPRTFTSHQACQLAGITFRQLDYWDRSGIIRPTHTGRQRNGYERRYTVADVERLTLVRLLLDAGYRLERSRLVLAAVRQAADDGITDGFIVADTDGVTVTSNPVEHINTSTATVVIVSIAAVRRTVQQALNRHDLAVA